MPLKLCVRVILFLIDSILHVGLGRYIGLCEYCPDVCLQQAWYPACCRL